MANATGIHIEKNLKGEILNVTFNWKKFKKTLEPILQEQGVSVEQSKETFERFSFEKMRAEGTPFDEVFNEIKERISIRYDKNGVKTNNL